MVSTPLSNRPLASPSVTPLPSLVCSEALQQFQSPTTTKMQYKQNMSTAVPEEFPYEGDAVEQSRDYVPFDE